MFSLMKGKDSFETAWVQFADKLSCQVPWTGSSGVSPCDWGQDNSKSTGNLEECTQLPYLSLSWESWFFSWTRPWLCAFGSEQRPGIVCSNQLVLLGYMIMAFWLSALTFKKNPFFEIHNKIVLSLFSIITDEGLFCISFFSFKDPSWKLSGGHPSHQGWLPGRVLAGPSATGQFWGQPRCSLRWQGEGLAAGSCSFSANWGPWENCWPLL